MLAQRLRKDMTYEFQVRFKGYGPEDDMWLPALSFNRTVGTLSNRDDDRKSSNARSSFCACHICRPHGVQDVKATILPS